jgi:hypothetical protein
MWFANMFLKPSKKQLIILISVLLFADSLLIIAITDGFNEPLFQRRYLMSYVMIGWSLQSAITLVANYYKHKSK